MIPNPNEDPVIIRVPVGGGAVHALLNPMCADDYMWRLHNEPSVELCKDAYSLADSYMYLVGDVITTKEAIRRLRILRHKWKNLNLVKPQVFPDDD